MPKSPKGWVILPLSASTQVRMCRAMLWQARTHSVSTRPATWQRARKPQSIFGRIFLLPPPWGPRLSSADRTVSRSLTFRQLHLVHNNICSKPLFTKFTRLSIFVANSLLLICLISRNCSIFQPMIQHCLPLRTVDLVLSALPLSP